MTLLSSRRVYAGRIVSLDVDTVRLPDGSTADFEMLRHPGAAAVVPFLDDPSEHRSPGRSSCGSSATPPTATTGRSRPAGATRANTPTARPGVSWRRKPATAAAHLVRLTEIWTTPGFTDEVIHLYLACDLTAGTRALEADEFVELHELRWCRVMTMVRDGTITDAKTLSALLHIEALQPAALDSSDAPCSLRPAPSATRRPRPAGRTTCMAASRSSATRPWQSLLDAALDPAMRDFNLDILSAQQIDPDALEAACATLPMMAERRVVVLRDVEAWKRKTKAKQPAVAYLATPRGRNGAGDRAGHRRLPPTPNSRSVAPRSTAVTSPDRPSTSGSTPGSRRPGSRWPMMRASTSFVPRAPTWGCWRRRPRSSRDWGALSHCRWRR